VFRQTYVKHVIRLRQEAAYVIPILYYPNATIASYGAVKGSANMMAEIYKHGPIACGINAEEIVNYTGGVLNLPHQLKMINHIISVVGWGFDESIQKQYWIIRNSWGSYWGRIGIYAISIGRKSARNRKNMCLCGSR